MRPALVVQNDRDNARMANTVVAQISGNTARVSEATQHLIELAADPGGTSEHSARRGLAGVTVVLARFRFALDSVAGGLCLLAYLAIGIFTHPGFQTPHSLARCS